jgi:hypothetical protein
MASAADAELVLKLYELRQEETLRKARRFLVFDFNPKTVEDLRVVSRDTKSEHNPSWRQGRWMPICFSTQALRGYFSMPSFITSTRRRRSRAAIRLWAGRLS